MLHIIAEPRADALERARPDGPGRGSPAGGRTPTGRATHAVAARLTAQGMSVWLDGSGRTGRDTGALRELIAQGHVTGIVAPWSSSAPSSAPSSARPPTPIPPLGEVSASGEPPQGRTDGLSAEEVLWDRTVEAVRQLCDALLEVHARTGGREGLVSVGLDPRNAWDAGATLAEARALWRAVDRPNLAVGIPATAQNLPVVTACLAESMNVHATLIFSVERFHRVNECFLDGLEQARDRGAPLSSLSAVASFSVSPLDTEVDRALARAGTAEARALTGTAAIANARLAYEKQRHVLASPRWAALAAAGALAPRPVWVSTAVRGPGRRDTRYVEELVAPGAVHALSEDTLSAVADRGQILGDTVQRHYDDARRVLSYLPWFGISPRTLAASLEAAHLRAAIATREALLASVTAEAATRGAGKE
ncbi:transaldolase family protein [Streptomyces sp. NPDC020858]|uniref:transaldolase family protein n=1 Tax=Streptomyces sp. NPDC020858 TaxID=3365097 RepID=UPI0037A45107